MAIDDALEALAEMDARKAKVVELRFILAISEDTVLRDWRLARSWLLREMARS